MRGSIASAGGWEAIVRAGNLPCEAIERRALSAAAEERSGPEATKVAPDPPLDCGAGGSG